MATFNLMNEQVSTGTSGAPVSTAQITGGQRDSSGAYVPSTVKTTAPQVISTTQLQPTTALQVPTPPPDITQADSSVAGATEANKSLQAYMAQFTAPPTAEQKQASDLTQNLQKLYELTAGQAQALADQENQLGVPDMQKQLAQFNADILSQSAAYNVAKADYERLLTQEEGRVATLGTIQGNQAQIQRNRAADLNLKASEIALTQARALGMQGNIEAAQAIAKRGVDLQRAPVLEQITIKQNQLKALQDSGILTRQEQAQAMALEAKYKDDQARIAEEKAKSKSNLDLALTLGINTQFINKNGEFINTRTGETYATPDAFFKAAGVSSFGDAYSKGLVSNVSNSTIVEKSQVGQLMADYWDAGITMADDLNTARLKIQQNSKKYRKETYIAGTGGGSGSGINPTGTLQDLDILAEAVSNKLGSVTAKTSFIKQYNSATTEDQKLKILASNVVLPNEIKTGIVQNTQVMRSLDDALTMLDKGVQTGLLQAGQSYVANKLGTGGDKQVEAIKSKLVAALQPYRNKVTGAAWGTQEENEYQTLIGSVKYTPEDLRNKLQVFKGTLREQSQAALLAGIDPLGAINQNSVIQNSPALTTPPSDASPEQQLTTPENKSWWSKTTNWLWGD